MSWTQEKEEKLRQLWEKGNTASQIAEILGDTTRNAVIGKAHRLKLAARAPNKKSVAQKKEVSNVQNRNDKQISRKSRFKSILLDKNFEPENPKKLEELGDNNCRWPIGHPDQEGFYFWVDLRLKDFLIVNCTCFTHSSLKIKKRSSSIKKMMFQNL